MNSIPNFGVSPELAALLENARRHKMSPKEAYEQRVSWIFGQFNPDTGVTKEQIRARLAEEGIVDPSEIDELRHDLERSMSNHKADLNSPRVKPKIDPWPDLPTAERDFTFGQLWVLGSQYADLLNAAWNAGKTPAHRGGMAMLMDTDGPRSNLHCSTCGKVKLAPGVPAGIASEAVCHC